MRAGGLAGLSRRRFVTTTLRDGEAYDNAMAESFFATLECELLERTRFETPSEARPGVPLRRWWR